MKELAEKGQGLLVGNLKPKMGIFKQKNLGLFRLPKGAHGESKILKYRGKRTRPLQQVIRGRGNGFKN